MLTMSDATQFLNASEQGDPAASDNPDIVYKVATFRLGDVRINRYLRVDRELVPVCAQPHIGVTSHARQALCCSEHELRSFTRPAKNI
jgi:hypothetical protein